MIAQADCILTTCIQRVTHPFLHSNVGASALGRTMMPSCLSHFRDLRPQIHDMHIKGTIVIKIIVILK